MQWKKRHSQSQKYKHYFHVVNLFKVNNKSTRPINGMSIFQTYKWQTYSNGNFCVNFEHIRHVKLRHVLGPYQTSVMDLFAKKANGLWPLNAMLCAIWYHLYNLKKREKHPWRSGGGVLLLLWVLLKVTVLHGCFSCFFKLYKWYQTV